MDSTTQILFGDFPREVGNPTRRTVYNRRQFERFIEENNGIRDCFVSVNPLGRFTEIFFDFDGPRALEETKRLYNFLSERKYPVIPVVSGKKGYHIHLLIKGDGEGREMLRSVTWGILHEAFGKNPLSVDTKVIGDARRLCRIPNTLRPPENRNWCTYLPVDFVDMDEKQIIEYSKKPHHVDYDLRNPPSLAELSREFRGEKPKKVSVRSSESADIGWVIERFVEKRVQGNGYWLGICPFHDDHNPSFAVYHDNFYCWGCGVHGDLDDFMRMIKKKWRDEKWKRKNS